MEIEMDGSRAIRFRNRFKLSMDAWNGIVQNRINNRDRGKGKKTLPSVGRLGGSSDYKSDTSVFWL